MGFIGSSLVPELASRGHEVWICDLGQSSLERYIRCDVSKFRQLERVFEKEKFDYVFHLAAEYGRWNGEDHYENLWMTNVVGTKNLIRLQEANRFRVILFSSAEVYGDYSGEMKEEIMDSFPIKQLNDYAMTKWVNEMQALNSEEAFGTETVRVRPVNAYGPGEHYSPYRGAIPIFIHNAIMRRPYTVYVNHKRIFDYIEDTCRTFANIVDNFKPGEVYNVAGRVEHNIKYVSDLILSYLGKDDSLVTYKDWEPFTTRVKTINCDKAISDLKHDPRTSLEAGLRRTIDWFEREYADDRISVSKRNPTVQQAVPMQ